jgi:hypothetical protein
MLAADRFYGPAQLIGWCREAAWSYRIRLKGGSKKLPFMGSLKQLARSALSLCKQGLPPRPLRPPRQCPRPTKHHGVASHRRLKFSLTIDKVEFRRVSERFA